MSVRDRLNQKAWEAEQKEKPVRPNINTGTQQAGTSTSVRGRQEAQEFAATPETFGPNTSNRKDAMTGVLGFNTSVRDRAILTASRAEEAAKPAVNTSIADQYLAEHNAREAAEEAQRQADIKSGKLKILGRGEF